MRIALTGASGFIGSYTAKKLHQAGHDVVALVRPSSDRSPIKGYVERFVEGTHDDESCFGELLDGVDVVIHNSVDFSNFGETALARDTLNKDLVWSLRLLAESTPRPIVFVSSVAAVSQVLESWDHLIDEEHPTRPGSSYGAYKAAVEAYLWAAHLGQGRRIAIVRPSAVYGLAPQVDRSHGADVIKQLNQARQFDRQGGGKFVHVEDVATMLKVCAEDERTNGRIFNLPDCYARWADWSQIAADELGIDARIDMSSPAQPKNQFDKRAAKQFGVSLDRGHAGIREHVRVLMKALA